ncbi:hypothetical protein Tco_1221732 [Tanacetum coccineum]
MAKEVGFEMVEEVSIMEGEEKDGLGGDRFVVDGGRSPRTSSKDEEDGGVENKSSIGSRLITIGEFIVVLIGDSGGWLLEKLVGLPMCSPMEEKMVDRKEKRHCEGKEKSKKWCTIYRRGFEVDLNVLLAENRSAVSAGAILKRAPA